MTSSFQIFVCVNILSYVTSINFSDLVNRIEEIESISCFEELKEKSLDPE